MPDGTRIGHVIGEESSKHVVADVVMRADIETGVGHGVCSSEEPVQRRRYRRGPRRGIGQLTSIEDEDLGPSNSAGERKRT